MKRGISVALSILQLLFMAGCAALVLLSKKSMGVMRYIANKNRVWGQTTWAAWMPVALGITAAGLIAWAVAMLASRKMTGAKRSSGLLAVMSLSTLLFVYIAKTDAVRAYYFICIAAVAIILIQAVKCALYKGSGAKKE